MTTYHPRRNDHGQLVPIVKPHTPTSIATWADPSAVATTVPDGRLPRTLNGVAFNAWDGMPSSKHEWNAVPGQLAFEEPVFNRPAHKRAAAGVVVREDDGRVWLVSPSNRYGGYDNTFPKGTIDPGVNMQASAIREAYEEAGLRVHITGFFADSDRSQSYTRYYLARRVGGSPAAMGWESQAVHLVPASKLAQFLTHANDLPLLHALTSTA